MHCAEKSPNEGLGLDLQMWAQYVRGGGLRVWGAPSRLCPCGVVVRKADLGVWWCHTHSTPQTGHVLVLALVLLGGSSSGLG
jgi:hypothetical protein